MTLQRLWACAQALSRRSPGRKPLPPLLFVTDPARVPDPVAVARRLPRGAGIVYRAFGAPGDFAALKAVARRRGLILIGGADEALGVDGLHLPERMAHRLPMVRARRPRWIVTTAAHSPRAVWRAARLGADAVLYSTVFESRSPSAAKPIGPLRLALVARRAPVPVYALGGVNAKNARRLAATGVCGLAMAEGLRT